jgi:hypothetical protein
MLWSGERSESFPVASRAGTWVGTSHINEILVRLILNVLIENKTTTTVVEFTLSKNLVFECTSQNHQEDTDHWFQDSAQRFVQLNSVNLP